MPKAVNERRSNNTIPGAGCKILTSVNSASFTSVSIQKEAALSQGLPVEADFWRMHRNDGFL